MFNCVVVLDESMSKEDNLINTLQSSDYAFDAYSGITEHTKHACT